MGEEGQKLHAVIIIKDNLLADITPTRDVIDDSDDSRRSGRAMERESTSHNVRLQDPTPLLGE